MLHGTRKDTPGSLSNYWPTSPFNSYKHPPITHPSHSWRNDGMTFTLMQMVLTLEALFLFDHSLRIYNTSTWIFSCITDVLNFFMHEVKKLHSHKPRLVQELIPFTSKWRSFHHSVVKWKICLYLLVGVPMPIGIVSDCDWTGGAYDSPCNQTGQAYSVCGRMNDL